MKDFCVWLDSLLGTTIRGQLVVDVTSRIEPDRSACVIVTIDRPVRGDTPIQKVADAVFDDGEETELVWHMVDVANYATEPQFWQYWDEFDEETADIEATVFCCPQCGGDHAGVVNARSNPRILRCHGHDVEGFLDADKRKDPLYKPPCGWEGEWPQPN